MASNARGRQNRWTVCIVLALAGPAAVARADATITSPGGNVAAIISVDANGHLRYRVTRDGLNVIDDSQLGITVDGIDLGSNVTSIGSSAVVEHNETYPWRGIKPIAHDHHNAATLTIARSGGGSATLVMHWRIYDEGVALRYQIPGTGVKTIGSEITQFALPPATVIWTHTSTSYYEGIYQPTVAGTSWSVFATPATCQVPPGSGYAGGYLCLLEGALYDYSGMVLEPINGTRTMRVRHQEPPWSVAGGSYTPWRIVLTTDSLDTLVNSNVVASVNPPPGPDLENADWIRPGRSVWSWWLHDQTTYDDQVPYMNQAAELGFEYTLWDEKWEYWTQAQLDYLLNYAKDKGLQVWLWKRYTTLDTESERTAFFDWIAAKNAALGGGEKIIVGVKIDFMNAESASVVAWYSDVLQHAADYELMLNFHGANKPTGTTRTFPNEMTREGIRGLEYNSWGDYLPARHNVVCLFTRLLGGHADYTPVTFISSRLGETTFAHQLSMAFLMTSPLTHWADHPDRYVSSPALDVIKASPTVWDETRVLPPSEIDELAVFARRRGQRWFLALANGNASSSRTVPVSLSFLAAGNYDAVLLGDSTSTAAAFDRQTRSVTHNDTLSIWMRSGGGHVAMFTPAQPTQSRADFDHDDDVDQDDFGRLQQCLAGSFVEPTAACTDGDLDRDDDVDIADADLFLTCFSGPNIPADINCP